jgi:hypothetical protein
LVIAAARTFNATTELWVRPPDVPVKVRVETAAGVVAVALRVVLCATLGTRLRVAGFAVTPAGRPVMETVTLPEKELRGLAVRLTCEPDVPAVIVSDAGAAVRVKSGGGTMVAATEEVCERAPEVPVRVSVAVPPDVAGVAEIDTFWAVPGVRVRVEGCAVTPLGKPVIATATMSVKPLADTALTLICWTGPPGTSETLAGLEERVKSTGGLE